MIFVAQIEKKIVGWNPIFAQTSASIFLEKTQQHHWLVGGLELWNFMAFHSVGNGKSSQLTLSPSFFRVGEKPPSSWRLQAMASHDATIHMMTMMIFTWRFWQTSGGVQCSDRAGQHGKDHGAEGQDALALRTEKHGKTMENRRSDRSVRSDRI